MSSPTALTGLATNLEPLSQTYDPPVRGPILVACHGRGQTDATLRIAGEVARRLGTSVEVAGVLEPYPTLLLGEEPAIYPPDFEAAQKAALESAIATRLRAVGPIAERWPVRIFYGDPAKTIASAARDHDSTMIVVGLGKHDLLDRLPGGERALHVVRGADRPVLAVAAGSVTLPRTAVAGMDFSPASVRAARAALMMLADDGVLVLVHVRPLVDLPMLRATAELSSRGYEELLERWHARAEMEAGTLFTRLREELRSHLKRGITIETQIRSGAILEQLLAAADEKGAHMIAVGTHGPGIFERLFVGSVATEVLRGARRTVLIAPAPNPAEAARIELRLKGTASLTRAPDWESTLDSFSARNVGRRVRLEVDDPDLGAQMQQSGFALLGITYDKKDKRVDVMMGNPADRTSHLTRSIPRVDDVSIFAAPSGPERALRILSGNAQTLVTFND
jgi:nucleotide-binding universal stress UspA family protein